MAAAFCADAGPVLDRTFGLPANDAGSLRPCSWHAAEQDQVGVWETDQSGARRGGAHQEGGSHLFYFIWFWQILSVAFMKHRFFFIWRIFPVFQQMLDEGAMTTTYSEQGAFQYDVQLEMLEYVMRDYTLLTCLKKDAHKMETFLKLLKCRQTDKYNCA